MVLTFLRGIFAFYKQKLQIFMEKSKSVCKIGKQLLIKLLVLGKMLLYDVTYLTVSVPKFLLLVKFFETVLTIASNS